VPSGRRAISSGHPAEKLAAAGFTVAGVDRSKEGLKDLPDGIWREAADPADPAAARSVVYLVSDAAALVSGAVVPAYGA
jgi:hypothetical protein